MDAGDPIRTVPALLRQHARDRGDQIAFSDQRREISYAELQRRTARIAGHLAGLGVRPGDRVAIACGNRVEAAESCLAVTRAAAVGVPLDPRASGTDLARVLRGSGARLVITDTAHVGNLGPVSELGMPVVLAGGERRDGCVPYEDLAESPAPADPADSLDLDAPAWMMYTSGTTGHSKGVLSSQRAAMWAPTACYIPIFGLSPRDRLLWPLPMFHSYAHSLCILGVLAAGASAHILGDEDLLRGLERPGITVLAGVPATFLRLVSSARAYGRPVSPGSAASGSASGAAGFRPVSPGSAGSRSAAYRFAAGLRVCVTAGAPCPPRLRDDVRDITGAPLLNAYGATETCGLIATDRPGAPQAEGACGQPLPGVTVRLVDPARMTDVADGGEGEIWVRGPNLLLGYEGEPEPALTDGWYRTGDLGRWAGPGQSGGSGQSAGPGQLAVTGRIRELIIRGGENIHPGEVERVLLACPGVADAAVAGAPHDVFGEVPVAYVVPDPGGFDPDVLLAACRAGLADFKVPDAVYEIAAVPRTPSGKIKRHELAAARARPAVPPAVRPVAGPAAPLGADGSIERLVLAETAALAGLDPADPPDPARPFTESGLTSMAAVQLRDRLSSLTGLALPATLIFDYPTPEAVCAYLRARLPGTSLPAPSSSGGQPGVRGRDDDDMIAIVSMACRYPGEVSSPQDLWRVVSEGRDVTSGFPADRGWNLADLYDPDPDALGKSVTMRGGFLREAADFDAALFKISPREAVTIDPQQRLLLETAWELAERARIAPSSLRDSDTGVFVGLMYEMYGSRFLMQRQHELEGHIGIESSPSMASGRLSYAFGLRGPSLTVDTACSSSLVAMHLAARALRAGECSLAIAGGVTVMASPSPFIAFSRMRGLAPDGRCKSFSAAADGTAWSEGAGLVLLERLSDARRNGHQVLALLRGTAVNSDGASNGITAPSGPAQERVIAAALADAGLRAADVDVVDGHGTGTALGDPIEARALLAAYGHGRETPLLLGSVKSNIGHSQASAGVAGVIKMVQAMRHGVAPLSLHAGQPSPHVDWSAGAVELLAEARPWPDTGRPRRSAVSSFGIGGTNAHVILEQPPTAPSPVPSSGPADSPGSDADSGRKLPSAPWLLSGADQGALRAQARALAEQGLPVRDRQDIAYSLAATRSALTHRVAIPAGNLDALQAAGRGEPHPAVAAGSASPGQRLALLFTGQGAQRARMGERLSQAFPAFAESFGETCRQLSPHLEQPLEDVIARGGVLLDRTDFAQAGLFAFEVAMARLLESFGVRASRLAGHSVGELAAAHIAGFLTLADAARLVAIRGTLMSALPGGGAMAAVRATESEVATVLARLAGFGDLDTAVIAAVNGPRSVVISGGEAAVVAATAEFEARGRRVTRLRVSHAFHSPLIEPMLDRFRAAIGDITVGPPAIPLISTVTGRLVTEDELRDPGYWVRQAREPVRFADAVRALDEAGITAYAETGPAAVLAAAAEDSITRPDPLVTATGRVSGDEVAVLLDALARMHVRGLPVDWDAVFAHSGARAVDLPTYPFQRRRYWLAPPAPQRASSLGHLVLSDAAPVPGTGQIAVTGRISLDSHPWLADHTVLGRVLLPGAAFAELAMRAGELVMPAGEETGGFALEELTVAAPLVVPPEAGVRLEVLLGEADADGRRTVGIHSRPEEAPATGDWTRHAMGTLAPAVPPGPSLLAESLVAESRAFDVWPPAGASPVDVSGLYALLADAGLGYGPAFQCVHAVWQAGADLWAEIRLADAQAAEAGEFVLHPALLDGALQALLAVAPRPEDLRLPVSWHGVRLRSTGATELRARLRVAADGSASMILADRAGALTGEVASVTMRKAPGRSEIGLTGIGDDEAAVAGALHRPEWVPLAVAPAAGSGAFGAADTVVRVDAGPDARDVPAAVRDTVTGTLDVLRKWSAGRAHEGGRLVLVTRNATVADPDLASAAALGLARSAQAEHPGRIILVDTDGTPESEAAMAAAIASGETQLAIRAGNSLIPRLTRVDSVEGAATRAPRSFGADGTVLITGGTGALGSLLARHLVAAHGVRHLLLISRSGGEGPGAAELASDLARAGATVAIVACDAADGAALEAAAVAAYPPVVAIVHAAGVLDDGVLEALDPERLATVLRPKVDGAWVLHGLARKLEPASFVLFSSAAGLLGNAGQGSYAAANAFLDALASHRDARGLPALSLAWGPWERVDGMAGGMGGGSLSPLTDRRGLELFDAAVAAGGPALAPFAVGRRTGRGHRGAHPAPTRAAASTWRAQLAPLPAAEREEAMVGLVRAEAAGVLGYDGPDDIDPSRDFTELGLDSLTGVMLRNRLNVLAGVQLSPMAVLDVGSAERLARHLLSEIDAAPVPAPAPAAALAPAEAPNPVPARPEQRLASLYRRVCETGDVVAAMHLLATASLALPTFGGGDASVGRGESYVTPPKRIASGTGQPALVCFPSFFQPTEVGVYGKLAACFEGERDVFEVAHPGISGAGAVPENWAVLASVHASAIRALLGGRPVVLAGHSTGGLAAQAVAATLAETGNPPAGLILIDSYPLTTESFSDPWLMSLPAAWALGLATRFEDVVDDTTAAAMGAYTRTAPGWQIRETGTATLFLRASDPVPPLRGAAPPDDWRASWPLPCETADLPGHHLELLDKHVHSTAAAIRAWLAR